MGSYNCHMIVTCMQVFLSSVVGLPGFGETPAEVAVKQLRCKLRMT